MLKNQNLKMIIEQRGGKGLGQYWTFEGTGRDESDGDFST